MHRFDRALFKFAEDDRRETLLVTIHSWSNYNNQRTSRPNYVVTYAHSV